MIAYHLDRNNSLQENMIINLNNNYLPNIEFKLISELFPTGLTKHGEMYISNLTYNSNPVANLNDVESSNVNNSIWMMEYQFELIRRNMFQDMPSRFQSFFALDNPSDFKYWPELHSPAFEIWEVEFDEFNFISLDSAWLKGGMAFHINGSNGFSQGFFPLANYYFAKKYWSGESSDKPRFELLLRPPIYVKRRINKALII